MRYMVDLAVFVVVFFFGLYVFKSGLYASLAGMVVAGATEALIGVHMARKG